MFLVGGKYLKGRTQMSYLQSGRNKCCCYWEAASMFLSKPASSVPTFKLLFLVTACSFKTWAGGPSQLTTHPSAAPQVLLPMVADLLRVQPLSSWTPKNHPHSLLMVKHLPRPSHCDPCLFLECWLLALASRCWGIAFLPGVACLKLLLVNPPALELVLKQGEVSSFLLGIK